MNLAQHIKLLHLLGATGQPAASSTRGDREIGKQSAHLGNQPEAQLATWLTAQEQSTVNRIPADENSIQNLLRAIGTGLFFTGIVVGMLAAAGVLYYDGSQPINVVTVFLALVVLPGVLLVLWWLAVLPAKLTARVPLVASLQNLIATLNPGRFAKRWLDKSAAMKSLTTESDNDIVRPYLAQTAKGLTLFWSQLFGVGFAIGALAAALFLVTFTDLAFGWSTTLNVESASMSTAANAVASPWQFVWPVAYPGNELVDATRFFRLDSAAKSAGDAFLAGRWWPFIIMCLFVYTLVPRLITLAFAARHKQTIASKALLSAPLVQSLLQRMNQPLIQTRASIEKDIAELDETEREVETFNTREAGTCHAINWAATLSSSSSLQTALTEQFKLNVDQHHEAGGAQSLAQDEHVINEISANSANTIVVAVKSWEPPLLEILDFLKELREQIKRDQKIVVLPFAASGAVADAEADAENLTIWSSVVERLEDNNTFVSLIAQPL